MSDAAKVEWRTLTASIVARAGEVAIAGLGIAYFVANSDRSSLILLGWYDLVALTYLTAGFFVVRRTRGHPSVPQPERYGRPWVLAARRRFSFLLTVVASLTGLTAASDALLYGVNDEHDTGIRTLAVIAVVCAWTLLHTGYAAFYRAHDHGPEGRGLRFPREEHPILLDYLYFAMTLGVSFAASDVEVIRRRTRWHVIVHEVVSFFYNTAILGIAVGVITGSR